MDLTGSSRFTNEAAFAALFDEHKNVVYGMAYVMLGNRDDAEDVLQHVFLAVYKSLSSFDPSRGTLRAWLRRITVNQCLNRRRRRRLFALSLDEVSPASVAKHLPTSEAQMAEEDVVRRALNGLSEKLRAVIVLRYYLDLSYAEIAGTLHIPVGTVKSRLDLALKTLRRELEAAGEGRGCPSALPQREAPK